MTENMIIRSYGTDYKEMTVRLLEEAGLKESIRSKTDKPNKEVKIGIKPNLVTPTPASFGATTHPEVVDGIIEYLKKYGYENISIIEGSWIGDKTSEAFEFCGFNSLAKKHGVTIVDTQKDTSTEVDCKGLVLNICSSVAALDYLINVPVMKGHCQTHITCALKNMKGLIPNSEKRRFHTMGLHDPIGHLNVGIKQDFIVVDHICGDLDFEEGGNPVVRNCIMAAKDPVLVDAFVCSLLDVDVKDVPYIGIAERLGVGCADIIKLDLVTFEGEDKDEKLKAGEKVLAVSYAVDDIDSCSACYASLIPALSRLKEEGLLEKLDCKIGIGQGQKGKSGKLGIGKCCSGFETYVKGCPPEEDKIYEVIKHYLENNCY